MRNYLIETARLMEEVGAQIGSDLQVEIIPAREGDIFLLRTKAGQPVMCLTLNGFQGLLNNWLCIWIPDYQNVQLAKEKFSPLAVNLKLRGFNMIIGEGVPAV
jgi:hypothetical protein